MDIATVAYAALGGIVPALVWLWFWDKEDAAHPEPRRFILLTFIAGMLTVALVIPLEQWAQKILMQSTLVIVSWAIIEEVMKFVVAYFVVLHRRDIVDEPIDNIIYLLTIALGFAAAENTLFLLAPLAQSGALESILTGSFRFLGATLLHVLASSLIGVALAFAHYQNRATRFVAALLGLLAASVIHAIFNLALLNNTEGFSLLQVFSFVWLGAVFLLLAFEKVKRLRARATKRVSR